MSEYIAAAGAVLLAVLGAVMAADAFTGRKRLVWIGIFLLLGVIVGYFTIISISENAVDRRELHNKIATLSGVNNYCFFEAIINDQKNYKSPVQLRITNDTDGPIRDVLYFISPYWVQGDASKSGYRAIMTRAERVHCARGSYPAPIVLSPGRYRIEFTNLDAIKGNSSWYEVLTIEQSYDKLISTSDIFFSDGKIIRSPRPLGYIDW